MPEEALITWRRVSLALTSQRIEESAVWAKTRRRADTLACSHIPDLAVILALLRQTCATAKVDIPVLSRQAGLRMLDASALAELSAPVSVELMFGSPGVARTLGFDADASALVVVEMIEFRADLVFTRAGTLEVVEILTSWAALNDASAVASFVIEEEALLAWTFDKLAIAGIFVEVHGLGIL